MKLLLQMLTSLRNAGMVGHETICVPYSSFVFEIANVLKEEGFIENVSKKQKKNIPYLEITLKYQDGKHAIRGIKHISLPSRRIYYRLKDIKPVKNDYGEIILSTPKGVLTGKKAKKEHVGGEALFEIW